MASFRILLPFAGALAACAPAPDEAARSGGNSVPATTAQNAREANLNDQVAGPPNPTTPGSRSEQRAAMGPIPEPVSAAENPAPSRPADSPAEARGRRTLSTAFVRVGPDGQLTVELRTGRVLVLRDVVMRPRDYCGVQVLGGPAGGKFCGGYADVAAARPGGAPAPGEPDLAAPNPLEFPRGSAERN